LAGPRKCVSSPRFSVLHTEEARVKIGGLPIYVFNASTGQLIISYLGLREACRELHMSHHTLRKYLASGLPYRGSLV